MTAITEKHDYYVLRHIGNSQTHAVGIKFVESYDRYPDTVQKRSGSKVPFFYCNGAEQGWPGTIDVIGSRFYNCFSVYRVAVQL